MFYKKSVRLVIVALVLLLLLSLVQFPLWVRAVSAMTPVAPYNLNHIIFALVRVAFIWCAIILSVVVLVLLVKKSAKVSKRLLAATIVMSLIAFLLSFFSIIFSLMFASDGYGIFYIYLMPGNVAAIFHSISAIAALVVANFFFMQTKDKNLANPKDDALQAEDEDKL